MHSGLSGLRGKVYWGTAGRCPSGFGVTYVTSPLGITKAALQVPDCFQMQPQQLEGVQGPGDFDSLEDLEPLSPTALSGIRVPSSLALGQMEVSSTASGSYGLPILPSEGPEEARAASSAGKSKKTRLEDSQPRAQSLPVDLAESERPGSGASEPSDKAREKNRRNQRTFRQRQKATYAANILSFQSATILCSDVWNCNV